MSVHDLSFLGFPQLGGSFAVIKHHNHKQLGKGMVYFSLQLSHCHSSLGWEIGAGTLGRNLEAGTEAEVMEEHSSLVASCSSLSLLFSIFHDQLFRGCVCHNGLSLPTANIN